MAANKEINSIIKAAEIMKCLAAGDIKLSHIARQLGYNKATVHRVLKTLEKVGLAIQDPVTTHYYPGPLLHSLSGNFLKTHHVLNEIALKHMEALRDATEESVNLQIPLGAQRFTVEIVHMVREYMFFTKPGDTSPIYSGAAGKVLLSMLSDTNLKLLLDSLVLLPITDKTVIDKSVLVEQLDQIRQQEYAIEFGEITLGAGAISVPVKNYSCPIALTIAGIETRLSRNSQTVLEQLRSTAKKISYELKMVHA